MRAYFFRSSAVPLRSWVFARVRTKGSPAPCPGVGKAFRCPIRVSTVKGIQNPASPRPMQPKRKAKKGWVFPSGFQDAINSAVDRETQQKVDCPLLVYTSLLCQPSHSLLIILSESNNECKGGSRVPAQQRNRGGLRVRCPSDGKEGPTQRLWYAQHNKLAMFLLNLTTPF